MEGSTSTYTYLSTASGDEPERNGRSNERSIADGQDFIPVKIRRTEAIQLIEALKVTNHAEQALDIEAIGRRQRQVWYQKCERELEAAEEAAETQMKLKKQILQDYPGHPLADRLTEDIQQALAHQAHLEKKLKRCEQECLCDKSDFMQWRIKHYDHACTALGIVRKALVRMGAISDGSGMCLLEVAEESEKIQSPPYHQLDSIYCNLQEYEHEHENEHDYELEHLDEGNGLEKQGEKAKSEHIKTWVDNISASFKVLEAASLPELDSWEAGPDGDYSSISERAEVELQQLISQLRTAPSEDDSEFF